MRFHKGFRLLVFVLISSFCLGSVFGQSKRPPRPKIIKMSQKEIDNLREIYGDALANLAKEANDKGGKRLVRASIRMQANLDLMGADNAQKTVEDWLKEEKRRPADDIYNKQLV